MVDWTGIAAVIAPAAALAGGLGGYWLAGRNEEARDKRAADRETTARRATLSERLEEERHTFQRDTLLELQDVLQRLTRLTTLALIQDQKTLKERGQMYQLPEHLGGEEALQVNVAVHRLRERVLNNELREAILDYINLCFASSSGRTEAAVPDKAPEEAIAELRRQGDLIAYRYVVLSDLLGEHLRRELDRRILDRPIDSYSR